MSSTRCRSFLNFIESSGSQGSRSPCIDPLSLTLQYEVPQRQHVHSRLEEAGDRVVRRGHDGLVLVEAGVENEPDARLPLELADEGVITRIGLRAHRLQPARAVRMRDGGNPRALLRTDLVDEQHERRGLAALEILPHALLEDARS